MIISRGNYQFGLSVFIEFRECFPPKTYLHYQGFHKSEAVIPLIVG